MMRWRLEKYLGYKTTLGFKVTNTNGQGIFDMIFATDHWAGEKIMTDLYSAAMRRQPGLRQKCPVPEILRHCHRARGIGRSAATMLRHPAPPAHAITRGRCPATEVEALPARLGHR